MICIVRTLLDANLLLAIELSSWLPNRNVGTARIVRYLIVSNMFS